MSIGASLIFSTNLIRLPGENFFRASWVRKSVTMNILERKKSSGSYYSFLFIDHLLFYSIHVQIIRAVLNLKYYIITIS